MRPGQLTLRDTAFVVCAPDGSGSGGFTGFGSNELGLRFGSTAAAATLMAACEAIVGDAGETPTMAPTTSGGGHGDDHPPHGPPPDTLTPGGGGSASTASLTPGLTPARPPPSTARSAASAASAYHTAQSSAPPSMPGSARRGGAAPDYQPPRSSFETVGDPRLQQAEQEILRLSALLAERDMEAGRLLKRLEQGQLAVRARDAKVAELTRRLNLLSSK